MTRQWLRDLTLVATGQSGTYDLTGLRVVFDVKQEHTQAPNTAEILVYNVAKSTAARFENKEFTRITLSAGYRGSVARIFSGNIKLATYGRETPTDTVLTLYCADGDEAYNNARVGVTLPPNSTPKDHVDVAFRAMERFNIAKGQIAGLPDFRYPRPVVLFGMARDVLRRICEFGPCSWSIQDETLQIVPKQGTLTATTTPELNDHTGLIGRPMQTPGGIFVRCLLRPEMRVNGTIRINNASVVRAAPDLSSTGDARNALIPSLDADGIYKVLVIQRVGDTHGRPWYNEMLCLAAGNAGWTPNNLIQYLQSDYSAKP